MKHLIFIGPLTALALAACSPSAQTSINTALASPPGQLFCSIQTNGGGSFVAGLVAVSLTAAAPTASPLFVLATNAGKAAVDADCAKAAASVPGAIAGVAVSPPVNPVNVPQVAIVAPMSPVVSVPVVAGK